MLWLKPMRERLEREAAQREAELRRAAGQGTTADPRVRESARRTGTRTNKGRRR